MMIRDAEGEDDDKEEAGVHCVSVTISSSFAVACIFVISIVLYYVYYE